jgi:4-hydroxybenzoate polyprenyltransferase
MKTAGGLQGPGRGGMKDCFELMRIRHYTKNLLVFMPLVFSGSLFSGTAWFRALTGFGLFSLLASLVYIVNDLKDLDDDRHHPVKQNRPLASGRMSGENALRLAFLLGAGLVGLGHAAGLSPAASGILCLYFLFNMAYSFGLKAVPFVDIFIIVMGFVLRVCFGGLLIETEISGLMLLTVISFATYLAAGKRRSELRYHGESRRRVLKTYSEASLNRVMAWSLASGMAVYLMWALSRRGPGEDGSHLGWTVLLVGMITLRYSGHLAAEGDGDPAEILLRDRVLLLSLAYGATVLGLLYRDALQMIPG